MSDSPTQPLAPDPAEKSAAATSLDSAGTPLMRQYGAIKKQHPNALLFFVLAISTSYF